jgi:radical SAM superfamily enzyme YgiQ (UPF0313 family)
MNLEISEDALNNGIDIVSIGEKDYIALDIVKDKDLKDIDGISYKDNTGNIIHNKPRQLIDNLDNLPDNRYAYDIMPSYFHNDAFFISTSRGCTRKCIYCSIFHEKPPSIRYRNPELVSQEITYLTNKYSLNKIVVTDQTFTENYEYVYQLMDCFDKYNLNIKWICQTRVDRVDKNILNCMKKHGCINIAYGADSMSQKVLNFIKKGTTIDQLEYAANITKEIGINIEINFLYGTPYETKESIIDSIKFCKKINPVVVCFFIIVPIPGTELYNYCDRNNLLLTKDWDLYSFKDQVIKIYNMSDHQIEKYQEMAFNMFNDNNKKSRFN